MEGQTCDQNKKERQRKNNQHEQTQKSKDEQHLTTIKN